MMNKVLILGGYGNFGKRISTSLAKANVPIIIAGRDRKQAEAVSIQLKKQFSVSHVEFVEMDINNDFSTQLKQLKPKVVINTVGPYQLSNYDVAKACIQHNVHYIDLADGREFVTGITALNDAATANDVLIVSGASTVPGLSSAVLEFYKNEFSKIESLIYGISPGQKTPRGLATAKSILTYLGKPLKPFSSHEKSVYGWQDIYRQEYPVIGKRWMANCDIPDLDLLPEKYGITSLRFSAGMESSIVHLSMWFVSWLVRLGLLPINLPNHAPFLLKLSGLFDWLGTPDGGMHMLIRGKDLQGKAKQINWYIIGTKGDGPQIPCIPAIVITKKLIAGNLLIRGAMPCLGIITLEEYLEELKGFSVWTMATEQ